MRNTIAPKPLVFAFLACSFLGIARAELPQTLHHQGRIAADGVNVDGAGEFKFLLYEGTAPSTGMAPLWSNQSSAPVSSGEPTNTVTIPVTKGLYSASLGAPPMAALPADLVPASGKQLYLRIWFNDGANGFQQLAPDRAIAAVPFAKHAETVDSVPASALPGTVMRHGDEISLLDNDIGYLDLASDLTSPSGDYVGRAHVSNDGNVGIGAWQPEAMLDIRSPIRIDVPTSPKATLTYHASLHPYLQSVTHAPINNTAVMAAMSRYGITLYDLTDQQYPVKFSQFTDGDLGMKDLDFPKDIAFLGDKLLAIMAQNDDAITLVEVTNPASPVQRAVIKNGVGGFSGIAGLRGIAARGTDTLAIWTNGAGVLTLADIKPVPNVSPSPVATVTSANGLAFGNLTDVAFDGDWMVVADGVIGSHLFDVSDTSSPQWVGQILAADPPFSFGNQYVDIAGDLVSVTYNSGSGELRLFDISAPSVPRELRKVQDGTGGFDHIGGPIRSRLDGGGLLLINSANEGSVTVAGVSDPRNPEALATFTDGQPSFTKLQFANRPHVGGGLMSICAENSVTLIGLWQDVTPQSAALLAVGAGGPAGEDMLRVSEQEVRIGDYAVVEGDLEVLGDLIFNPSSLPSNIMLEGENVSLLQNDAGYLDSIAGENISLLNNDSGYLTSISGMNISLLNNNSGYLSSIAGQNVSLLNNDANYTTRAAMLAAENTWTNANSFTSPHGIVATGSGGGVMLAEGFGRRMLWYPTKSSFRAGEIIGAGGENWDANKTGQASAAFGSDTLASGDYSFAAGKLTEATGQGAAVWGWGAKATGIHSAAWGLGAEATNSYATAWGRDTEARGAYSTAWGRGTDASGAYSTAFGDEADASGDYSTAAGRNIEAKSFGELAVGRWSADSFGQNLLGATTWRSADPLLTVGNGANNLDRSNAFQVTKGGDASIGGALVVGRHEGSRGGGGGLYVWMDNGAGGNFDDGFRLRSPSGGWDFAMSSVGGGDLRVGYDTPGGVSFYDPRGSFDSSTGKYTNTSDRRLKKNIEPLEPVLKRVGDLELIRYQMKTEPDRSQSTFGVIAQDVQNVFPEVVEGTEGDDSYLSVSYSDFGVIALKAIQEQQELIENQAAAIRALEARLEKAGL